MHELSIAENIIEIVEESVKQNNGDKVVGLDLEIGELSGVVTEALKMALDSTVKDTIVENAEIKIFEVEGEARCNECNEIFAVHDLYTPCPKCNSYNIDITKGKELKIKSITLENN